MNPYLEIIRPGNVVMALIAVILIGIIDFDFNIPLILALFAVFFAMSGGNVINDYFDYEIDTINRPERPIPSGRISRKKARNYSYFLFIAAIVVGFLIYFMTRNPVPWAIVVFAVVILYLYAYIFKSTPLIGNIIVGLLTGLCFIFAGYTLDNPTIISISYYLAFFAFVMTTAREITKDIEDIEGDKKEGANTFPIKFGKKIAGVLAFILIVIDSVLCPLLYFDHVFNAVYLVIVAVAVIIFLYAAILLIKDQDPKTCKKVSKYLKIGMLIAFVAFALGSF